MKVEQLMTKGACACSPDDTANDAARVMWERDCGFVPVTEPGPSQRLVGVVTDRDVCMAAYTTGRPLRQIQVRDVMSTGIHACRPGDDVADAEKAMRSAQLHRLPVLDDAGQLLGVISLADVAREATREAGSRRQEVTLREIGDTLAAIVQSRQPSPAPAA